MYSFAFSESSSRSNLDPTLIHDLLKMVDEFNVLAESFRRVRDFIEEGRDTNVALRLFRKCMINPHTYNLPNVDEVATLIVGDFDSSDCGCDIIIRTRSGFLQRIPECHTSFLPLQYPIMFPYGIDGYEDNIGSRQRKDWKQTRFSLRE